MLKFSTAGESHGKGLIGIIEGMPAGMPVNEDYINLELSRRQKGYGRGGRMKIESDKIESGSVDLILTDLPYGTVNGLGNSVDISHGMKNKTDWDVVIDTDKIIQIANRILRKNGKMVLFAQQPFTNELINKALPNLPFNYAMIWEKDHFANALTAKKAPLNYYEDVLVFSKGSHGTYGEDDSYRKMQKRRKCLT